MNVDIYNFNAPYNAKLLESETTRMGTDVLADLAENYNEDLVNQIMGDKFSKDYIVEIMKKPQHIYKKGIVFFQDYYNGIFT